MSEITKAAPQITINMHFKKMKDKNIKQILSESGYQWEGRGLKKRVMKGKYDGCNLYGAMKPVEIVLRRKGG
jgi:hypothetical protein